MLTHDLGQHYATLRKIRDTRALERSELWPRIRDEVARVTTTIERGGRSVPAIAPPVLRAAAWNIQRGTHFDLLLERLTEDPILRAAHLLLLTEVDNGMARSGNRHVARDLAEALHMEYAFAPSYLVLEDDFGENADAKENALALAGCALLSRVPLGRVEHVDIPAVRDKFSSSEKRLGKKSALVAELALPVPITVAVAHLDSNASPTGREGQLAAITEAIDTLGHERVLVGGDLNTTTYDASSGLALAWNVLHKLVTLGVSGAVRHYMTPELRYERPVFDVLRRAGLTVDGFNDRRHGTMNFDLNDPYALEKTRRHVGDLLTRIVYRATRRWNHCVPARLDWFAGKNLAPRDPAVVTARTASGRRASDHDPIVVDIA